MLLDEPLDVGVSTEDTDDAEVVPRRHALRGQATLEQPRGEEEDRLCHLGAMHGRDVHPVVYPRPCRLQARRQDRLVGGALHVDHCLEVVDVCTYGHDVAPYGAMWTGPLGAGR